MWKSSVTLQSTTADGINDAVKRSGDAASDEFIEAWTTHKSHRDNQTEYVNTLDANAPKNWKKHPPPLAATQAAQETYIASKNSKVFPSCQMQCGKTISPENVVSFATRDAAASSGRKPCKKCNP